MQKLYCFKIDEKNATITRYEIDDYREITSCNGALKIIYDAKLGTKDPCTHSFSKSNLDKVINLRIHSFNPDIEAALSIANAYLVSKRDEAYQEYNRYNELIIHLNKNQ